MSAKLTIADWKAFLADDVYWDGVHYDEALFEVNGEEVAEIDDDSLADTAIVKILMGEVLNDEDGARIKGLVAFYRQWKKQQDRHHVLVEVPSSIDLKDLKAVLAPLGGKVLTS